MQANPSLPVMLPSATKHSYGTYCCTLLCCCSIEEAGSCGEDETADTLELKDRNPSFQHILTHWPTDVAGSHIWDESVRLEVKETKIPEHELNRKRSKLLVPGSRLELGEEEISHIPLLLIQQPGCSGEWITCVRDKN